MSEILSDERVSFDYDRSIATREGSNVANYMLRELMVAAGKPIVARGDTPQAVWRETLEDVAALRSRLAEVEADRDRWHAAYEEEVEVGGARLAAVEGERDAQERDAERRFQVTQLLTTALERMSASYRDVLNALESGDEWEHAAVAAHDDVLLAWEALTAAQAVIGEVS